MAALPAKQKTGTGGQFSFRYRGQIDDLRLQEMAALVRLGSPAKGQKDDAFQRAAMVLIELGHNVFDHGLGQETGVALKVELRSDGVFVSACAPISLEHRQPLLQRIEELNEMSVEQLEEEFFRLGKYTPGKQSAGLGLVVIAREAKRRSQRGFMTAVARSSASRPEMEIQALVA
jgi:hypothetical protein